MCLCLRMCECVGWCSHVGSRISAEMQWGKCIKFRNWWNFMHFYEFHILLYLFFYFLFIQPWRVLTTTYPKFESDLPRDTSPRFKNHLFLFKTTSWSFWSAMQTFVFWLNSNISLTEVLFLMLRVRLAGTAWETKKHLVQSGSRLQVW